VNADRIKVLIVDDSSVQRKLLRDALGAEPDIEIISQAVNGRLALPRVRHLKPDVVLLDQEMPEMTGLETLAAIRQESPESAVIMYCAPSPDSARVTVQALHLGASDFVLKPGAMQGGGAAAGYISAELASRIRALSRPGPQRGQVEVRRALAATRRVDLCVIGVSTGGPQALREIFARLENIHGAIAIVQHMPPLFTAHLAESLNEISAVTVTEATHGQRLEPGAAVIAPGGAHLEIARDDDGYYAVVHDGPAEMNCKPSVNALFRSAARAAGERTLGVIMTGMGSDGYEGALALHAAGAVLVAQSEASCLIYGMPARPVEAGLVSEILDPTAIADRIMEALQ
jgi:two-component system chemotaxis response regulator CheB